MKKNYENVFCSFFNNFAWFWKRGEEGAYCRKIRNSYVSADHVKVVSGEG
jgi:hypothetical protein